MVIICIVYIYQLVICSVVAPSFLRKTVQIFEKGYFSPYIWKSLPHPLRLRFRLGVVYGIMVEDKVKIDGNFNGCSKP